MNISSEICTTDGSNYSDYIFFSSTKEIGLAKTAMDIIIVLLGFPINCYVIWLIVTGTGNGLAAEFFSLNLAVCEMLFYMECIFNLISYNAENVWIAASFVDGIALTCRPVFQCLISVERYLAVVHPVTFLKYKLLRYRVICSVIVWVASFVFGGIIFVAVFLFLLNLNYIFVMAHISLFFFIQLFCLVAVLRALKQSGPGERGRERGEENHMKRRAFYIILITSVTMLIIFFPFMILSTVSSLVDYGEILISIGFLCFTLAGLVQPLLFLYRVRKLPFMKCQ